MSTATTVALGSRRRPPSGAAVDRTQFPLLPLVISIAAHVALAAGLIAGAAMWKASQPKAIVVNLVPAIPALGTPKAPPSPTPARAAPQPAPPTPAPRVIEEPPPRVSRPAPDLPTRAPEPRPRDIPKESPPAPPPPPAPMPPRELPTRELPRAVTALDRRLPPPKPALARPGEKEVPAVQRLEPPRPMPEFSRPAPQPPAPPPPAPREVTPPASRGLPSGSPAGSGAIALRADGNFQANWYFQDLVRRIEKKWQAPGSSAEGQQAVVLFELARDGRVLRSEVKESSGNFLFDQAALRAVTESGPFRELPAEIAEHGPPFRFHLNFEFTKQQRG